MALLVFVKYTRTAQTCRYRCCFSTEVKTAATVRVGAVPDPMLTTDGAELHLEPSPGLRPENSPASTPANVGCKAYYTARNIDIGDACKVRHTD